jgi:hypothetical protein
MLHRVVYVELLPVSQPTLAPNASISRISLKFILLYAAQGLICPCRPWRTGAAFQHYSQRSTAFAPATAWYTLEAVLQACRALPP